MSSTSRGRIRPSPERMTEETYDRVKRIETRLTTAMIALGIGTPAQRPVFFPATDATEPRVEVPSRHTSLQDVIDTIPKTCHGTVGIFVGSDKVAAVDALRESPA